MDNILKTTKRKQKTKQKETQENFEFTSQKFVFILAFVVIADLQSASIV